MTQRLALAYQRLSHSKPIDCLILSNGPGEVTTWVLPVVKALRSKWGENREKLRISVVLAPCSHASGKEAEIAANFTEVDRVQSSEYFWKFLLLGKTAANWDWHPQGLVIFLGGDQFFAVTIARRLQYQSIIYAEWDARWLRYGDRFALGQDLVKKKVPARYQDKCIVVGNLMADLGNIYPENHPREEIITLLPGSKSAKLAQGVPLTLSIATEITQQRPSVRFILPVAPTLDLATLAKFANPDTNPVVRKMGNITAKLTSIGDKQYLETPDRVKIELITRFPAFDLIVQSRLCITTVGANTAQLATLGIPMLVLIPTQQLDAMRCWDGIPGLLANLPGIGYYFASLINWLVLRQKRLFAWPNIWAKTEIVPELVGELSGEAIATSVIELLDNPQKLQQMRDLLLAVSPPSGAASRLVTIIDELISYSSVQVR